MTTKEHLTLHDKQIAAIRLVASQQRTERNLKYIVRSRDREGAFLGPKP